MKRINRLAARAFIDGKHFAKGGTVVHVKRRKVMLLNNGRLLAHRPEGGMNGTVIHWANATTDDDNARLQGLLDELNEDGRELTALSASQYL